MQIGLGIIFNFMNLFSHSFWYFLILSLFCFIFELLFDLFEILVNIFCMVKFFCSKISLKERSFQPISKLDFIIFDHWSLILRALEIFKSTDCTIMFTSAIFVPFNTYPELFFAVGRLSSVLKISKVSDNTTSIIK